MVEEAVQGQRPPPQDGEEGAEEEEEAEEVEDVGPEKDAPTGSCTEREAEQPLHRRLRPGSPEPSGVPYLSRRRHHQPHKHGGREQGEDQGVECGEGSQGYWSPPSEEEEDEVQGKGGGYIPQDSRE